MVSDHWSMEAHVRLLNRAANRGLADWLAAFNWAVFATLTVDARRLGFTSSKLMTRQLRQLFKAVSCRFDSPLYAFFVLEAHATGEPHAHGLLALADQGVAPEQVAAWTRSYWFKSVGWSQVEPTTSPKRAARYVTKHFSDVASEFVASREFIQRRGEPW